MSDPYVIWTMRRTGGTTLATLLNTLSEHPTIEHEPFNPERRFGHVSADFKMTNDAGRLRDTLMICLQNRPLIKYCYELLPPAFNAALLEVTTALGYRHIILDRRSEADRILSLELAQMTGAWGGDRAKQIYPGIEAGEVTLPPINEDKVMREMTLCRARRQELVQMIASITPAPFVVYFEDVYSDPQAGRALIARLLAFLGIRSEAHEGYDKLVSNALLHRGQNTARIMDAVPNIKEIRAAMKALQGADIFAPS